MNFDASRRRRGLYRSRNGVILGVCKGISQYVGVSIKVIRVIAVIALIATGFWPAVAIYLLAAFFMKPEPLLPVESELEEEFYNSYTGSRTMALQRLRQQFERLDRRIQRMESTVTDSEFTWEQRLNS